MHEECKNPFAKNYDRDCIPKACNFLAEKLNTDSDNVINLVKPFLTKVKYWYSLANSHLTREKRFDAMYNAHKTFFNSNFVLKQKREESTIEKTENVLKKPRLDGKFCDRLKFI